MAVNTQVHLPHLRFKLTLLRAHAGWTSDRAAALAMGLPPTTLNEFINGGRAAPEMVTQRGLDRLSTALAATLRGSVTLEAAEALWRGERALFHQAFSICDDSSFRSILTGASRARIVEPIVERAGQAGMVEFEPDELDDPILIVGPGDRLRLRCHGAPGLWVVVLLEVESGVYLCAPRHGRPLHYGADASLLVPSAEESSLKFKPPGGLHRFWVFNVGGATAPEITKIERPLSPLRDAEIQSLVWDLKDVRRAPSWRLDELQVFLADD